MRAGPRLCNTIRIHEAVGGRLVGPWDTVVSGAVPAAGQLVLVAAGAASELA